jgi:outer membrane protein assembly factor BamD (BamD/ComL family)
VSVRAAVLAAALVAGACTSWLRPHPSADAEPAATLAKAHAEDDAGHTDVAVGLYERVAHDHPATPAAAEALHALVVLRLDPDSPARDRHAAESALARLVADYPKTRTAAEGRAWRVLLRRLSRCEVEAARRGADAQKLRETLDSLKDSDIDLEQR